MNEPHEKQTEFDGYAQNYADLIRDPVRERFASSNRFFVERKLRLIESFCAGANIEMKSLDWLDVGCGQGELLRLGGHSFKRASGCDPSTGMLEFCSDLNVRIQPSIDVLPFEDRAFDFITIVCVYHHVPHDRRLALTREAMRLLRPQGILCLIEHNPLNPVTKLIVSRTPVDADAHLLTARRSRRLLLSSGMAILETRYFLLFPERFYKPLAFVESGLGAIPFGGQYVVFGQKQG